MRAWEEELRERERNRMGRGINVLRRGLLFFQLGALGVERLKKQELGTPREFPSIFLLLFLSEMTL